MLKRMKLSVAVIGMLSSALAYSVNAETLYGPLQGNTLSFADHAVNIYYTEKGEDFEVVTTVGANSNHNYLYRVITDISDNEQHRIVIGGAGDNKTHVTLTLSRVGSEVTADIHPQETIGQDNLTFNQ